MYYPGSVEERRLLATFRYSLLVYGTGSKLGEFIPHDQIEDELGPFLQNDMKALEVYGTLSLIIMDYHDGDEAATVTLVPLCFNAQEIFRECDDDEQMSPAVGRFCSLTNKYTIEPRLPIN